MPGVALYVDPNDFDDNVFEAAFHILPSFEDETTNVKVPPLVEYNPTPL